MAVARIQDLWSPFKVAMQTISEVFRSLSCCLRLPSPISLTCRKNAAAELVKRAASVGTAKIAEQKQRRGMTLSPGVKLCPHTERLLWDLLPSHSLQAKSTWNDLLLLVLSAFSVDVTLSMRQGGCCHVDWRRIQSACTFTGLNIVSGDAYPSPQQQHKTLA